MLFIAKQLDILRTCIFGVNATVSSCEALGGGGVVVAARLFGGRAALVAAARVFSGTRADSVRVALWVLLFVPVAAVIRLAGLFAVILITAVLIIPLLVFKKSGGKMFDINIDIGLNPSPDEGIGCLLGVYLCGCVQ